MPKTLVVTEKKSVAEDFAKVNKVPKKGDMSFESDRFVIAWASGHLLELKSPDAYDKKFKQQNFKIDRKSFINTQYTLFQLLRRHKHPCKEEDFNMLKTLDRKSFLDDICSQLFQELGWNFTPIF